MADTQNIDFGFVPRPWQVELFLQKTRFRVTVIHRRAGKTVYFVLRLIDTALRQPAGSFARYGYVAPYLKQSKDIAWDYLKRYAAKVPGTNINSSELWVEFTNGARIRLYGADNIDAMRGSYFDGLVLDEASQIAASAWEEVLYPTLTDRDGWAEIGGTPKGINFLSERYEYAREAQDPLWSYVIKDVYQTGVFTPEKIEEIKRTIKRKFSQEYLCDFNASAENSLVQLQECYDAAKRVITLNGEEPRLIGVDVGRQGDDPSAICRREGKFVHPLELFHERDTMGLAARVAHLWESWNPDAVFIDMSGGWGTGVFDRLKVMGYRPIGVNFSSLADASEEYANKRAEMYFRMADDIGEGLVLPNDPQLFRELTAVQYFYKGDKLALIEKAKIKKTLDGMSTDRSDALALTYAYPIARRRYDRRMEDAIKHFVGRKDDDTSIWADT